MGITGLLPFLKKASKEANISQFAGQAAAIDVYCWLHKGAFSCAEKILKGEKTDGYVHYCMKMVNMVKAAGVKPILVFDGRRLPSKHLTEKKRREARQLNKQKAKDLLRDGKLREAREMFQRAVDITPDMAQDVIEACRQRNIDFIVAPYEADAQLAYLNKIGIAQVVITEDSDLVLFGCDKILYKMDVNGCGILFDKSQIGSCLGNRAGHFTFDKFRQMCILSGCDYAASLPGIGLGKAGKFFSLTSNPNLEQTLPKLPAYLKMPQLSVTPEYIRDFLQAEKTFLYQLVFCPRQRRLVPLTPYPDDLGPEDLPFAGEYLPDNVALDLAQGRRHLNTLHPLSAPQEWGDDQKSMWSQGYKGSSTQSSTNPQSAFVCTSSSPQPSTPARVNQPRAKSPPSAASILTQYKEGASPERKRPRLSSSSGKSDLIVKSKYFMDKQPTGFAWSSPKNFSNPFKASPQANAPYKPLFVSSQTPPSSQSDSSSILTPLSPNTSLSSSGKDSLDWDAMLEEKADLSQPTESHDSSSFLTPLSQSSFSLEDSQSCSGRVECSNVSLEEDPLLGDIVDILSQSTQLLQKENSSPCSAGITAKHKPSRRPVGLSKKSQPNTQPSIKESLLKFQFTRK